MKIGIPRALICWKRTYFWKSFFENLGFEVLLSPKTNKEIVEMGVKVSDPETCLQPPFRKIILAKRKTQKVVGVDNFSNFIKLLKRGEK